MAEALATYAARRHLEDVSGGNVPDAPPRTRRDHRIAGFSFLAIAAEFAWIILAFIYRLPGVVGWPVAAAILALLIVAYAATSTLA